MIPASISKSLTPTMSSRRILVGWKPLTSVRGAVLSSTAKSADTATRALALATLALHFSRVAQALHPVRFLQSLLTSAKSVFAKLAPAQPELQPVPVASPNMLGSRRVRHSPFLYVLFLLYFLALATFSLIWSPGALAQDSKSQLRTVRGVVAEKSSEAPIASAVVFLKNTRTNDIRSYISDPEGNYRFSGLDPNVDYEVHAEKEGAKSVTRTVSSFDSKKEIVLNLKLEKKK